MGFSLHAATRAGAEDEGGRDALWKRWTETEARAELDEAKRSGLSLREFSIRRGFGARRLDRWSQRLRVPSAITPISFEEIRSDTRQVRDATSPPRDSGLEVVLGAGRVVRLSTAFDDETFQRLLSILERSC